MKTVPVIILFFITSLLAHTYSHDTTEIDLDSIDLIIVGHVIDKMHKEAWTEYCNGVKRKTGDTVTYQIAPQDVLLGTCADTIPLTFISHGLTQYNKCGEKEFHYSMALSRDMIDPAVSKGDTLILYFKVCRLCDKSHYYDYVGFEGDARRHPSQRDQSANLTKVLKSINGLSEKEQKKRINRCYKRLYETPCIEFDPEEQLRMELEEAKLLEEINAIEDDDCNCPELEVLEFEVKK